MGPSVAMAMLECAAASTLPSSSLTRCTPSSSSRMGAASTSTSSFGGWAGFPMRERRGKVRQCDGGMRVGGLGPPRRGVVARRAEGGGEKGSAGGSSSKGNNSSSSSAGKDRSVVLEESKRLLAMQKALLDQVRNFSFRARNVGVGSSISNYANCVSRPSHPLNSRVGDQNLKNLIYLENFEFLGFGVQRQFRIQLFFQFRE